MITISGRRTQKSCRMQSSCVRTVVSMVSGLLLNKSESESEIQYGGVLRFSLLYPVPEDLIIVVTLLAK